MLRMLILDLVSPQKNHPIVRNYYFHWLQASKKNKSPAMTTIAIAANTNNIKIGATTLSDSSPRIRPKIFVAFLNKGPSLLK